MSLLLLYKVQLGDPSYMRTGLEYTAADSMRTRDWISTKTAGNPANELLKWMDAKAVKEESEAALMPDCDVKLPLAGGNPNEYIFYDVVQVRIRYVFMLKWTGSREWGFINHDTGLVSENVAAAGDVEPKVRRKKLFQSKESPC